jgi:aquaporin Z
VSGQLSPLWIYLTAPVAGALLAVALCRAIREDCCGGCCTAVKDNL